MLNWGPSPKESQEGFKMSLVRTYGLVPLQVDKNCKIYEMLKSFQEGKQEWDFTGEV